MIESKSIQKNLFVDCTFTYQSGLNTGIQRVVRNILMRSSSAGQYHGYKIRPVVCILGSFYEISVSDILDSKPIVSKIGLVGKGYFEKIRNNAKSRIPLLSSRVDLLGKLEDILRKVFRLIKLGRLLLLAYRYRYRKVFIGQDDRFLFLDVFWTGGSLNALKKINIPRCNVSAVIYDLIPITHPQFVESANQRNFASNLPVLMEVAANYLCISETVASDLQRHTVSDQTRAERVLSFKLGSDFGPRVSTKKGVMQIGGVLKLQPWLVVGTIEPRKNHKYILDSFEALWAQGREESLLIVGRIGWMCEEIMMRLHSHSELGKRLFVFNDLDDAALDECYRQSKGLIFASYVEGFGLPLVEAFQRKIPVVCSDIPVFREVAGDAANYFDLSHRDGLLKLISAHKSEWHKGAKGIEWPSWDDSAKDFFDKLLGKRT